MRCNICRDKQIAYERGELPQHEREAIEAHLQSCARCRQYYREVHRLEELLQPVELEGPRRDMWPRIAGRIAGHRTQTVLGRLVRPVAAAAMVAAVAVTLLTATPPRGLSGSAGEETLVKHSETGIVWIDPWAGPAAQGLDWILADMPETKAN